MKAKKLILLVSALCFLAISFASTSSTASAVTKTQGKSFYWWEKPRTVVITQPKHIYEIQGTNPRYKSYIIRRKTLKPGDEVKIQHVASYDWLITGHGLANGYFHQLGRFWIASDSKWEWFDRYTKWHYVEDELYNAHSKHPHKIHKVNWKQYKKLFTNGVLY